MRRYGISEPEFLALSDAQQGLCALCARPHQAVDHSPSTGDVRGLLCHYCNGRLHAFDHNPEWLSRATAYVEGR